MTVLPPTIRSFLSLPSSRLAWAVTVLLVVAGAAGTILTGISVESDSVRTTMLTLACSVAGFLVLGRIVDWRLSGDSSRPAAFLRTALDRLRLGVLAFAFLAFLTAPCALLSYLSLATSLPLQDAAMVAFDRSLGIDWLAVVAAVNENAVVREVLAFAYRSLIPQAIVLVFVLAVTDRKRDLSEFLALFALTGLLTCIVSGLVPTEGAYYFLKPDKAIYANLDPSGGLVHHAVLSALRDGSFTTFSLDDVKGLVTFPSFHTALALVIAYCGARLRFVGGVVVVLNLLIVASTMAEGGHYFADIAGGAVLAFAAIGLVRLVNGGARERETATLAGAAAA